MLTGSAGSPGGSPRLTRYNSSPLSGGRSCTFDNTFRIAPFFARFARFSRYSSVMIADTFSETADEMN